MSELTCFKAYDIRGEIGVNIDEGIAYRIGRAVAQHFNAKSVVIGFDARETSPAFAAAAARAHGRRRGCLGHRHGRDRGNVLGRYRIWGLRRD